MQDQPFGNYETLIAAAVKEQMRDVWVIGSILLLLLVLLIAVLSIYSTKLFTVDRRNHRMEEELREVLNSLKDTKKKQKKMQDHIYSLETQVLACPAQRTTRTPSIGSTGSDAESMLSDLDSPHVMAGYQWMSQSFTDSKGKRRSPKKCRSPIRRATSVCGSSCMSLTKEERTTLASYKRLSPNNVDYSFLPHNLHFDDSLHIPDFLCGEELFDIEEKSSTQQHMQGCSSGSNLAGMSGEFKRAPSQSSGSRFYANVVREKSGYSSAKNA
eukprot:768607-Hanusia_phi.AAC.6